MFVSMTMIEDELVRFVQNYADDRGSLLELLRFLGKHPYTRFSRAAIILALKKHGILVDRGLKYLIANGIVSTETENKIQLYSLKPTEEVRNWASGLMTLDWRQWQLVMKNVLYAD